MPSEFAPQVEVPEVEIPKVELPEIEVPQAEVSESNMPFAPDAEIETPDLDLTDSSSPAVETSVAVASNLAPSSPRTNVSTSKGSRITDRILPPEERAPQQSFFNARFSPTSSA